MYCIPSFEPSLQDRLGVAQRVQVLSLHKLWFSFLLAVSRTNLSESCYMNDEPREDSNGNQGSIAIAAAPGERQGSRRSHSPNDDPPSAPSASTGTGTGTASKPEIAGEEARTPTPEEEALYGSYLAEIEKRELSASEQFDKSVLTISSAGLGLSLTLLKDVIQLDRAMYLPTLYASWVCFVGAILCTLLSFLASGRALDHQKGVAFRAYRLGEGAAFTERNPFDTLTRHLNRASATCFVFALVLTTAFVIINLERNRMATNQQPAPGVETRGATVPTMQRPVSQAPAPAPAPTPLAK